MNLFIHDFIQVMFKQPDSWLYLAWHDVLSKYHRTVLGPFWSIIVTAISIVCISVFWGLILRVPLNDFLPHVASGIVIWTYIMSIVNESCALFINRKGALQNTTLPITSVCLRLFARNTILFIHNLAVLLPVLYIYNTELFNINVIFLLLYTPIILLNSISVSVILGFFSTRFRDVMYIIQSITSALMMMTPVIWKIEMLGKYQFIAYLNPFTHFLNLLRFPMLGENIDFVYLGYVIGITAANCIIAAMLYSKFKHRLVFWL